MKLSPMTRTANPPDEGSLAILVNSDRHPDYVLHLARAAREAGKHVHVHFFGEGIRLADRPRLEALSAIAAISVCRESVADQGNPFGVDDTLWVPAESVVELVRRCDRYVVF